MSGDLATAGVEELVIPQEKVSGTIAVGCQETIVADIFWVRASAKLTLSIIVDIDVDVNVDVDYQENKEHG